MFSSGNKERLYVALYARGGASKMPGGEDTYHWSLLTCPKVEPEPVIDDQNLSPPLRAGKRFHVKTVPVAPRSEQDGWEFEERTLGNIKTQLLLVRVLIAKVEDVKRLTTILRQVPIRAGQEGHDGWNCVAWVKEAIRELASDDKKVLGATAVTDWDKVRDAAVWYVQKKKAEGRFNIPLTQMLARRPATWDMLLGEEMYP